MAQVVDIIIPFIERISDKRIADYKTSLCRTEVTFFFNTSSATLSAQNGILFQFTNSCLRVS
jgi:hypothetical protein